MRLPQVPTTVVALAQPMTLAMNKAGWPQVNSTPPGLQLAVVGERYDLGFMTENEAVLVASQIINETIVAGAQVELTEAELKDQQFQQAMMAMGQQLQAQDQFNRQKRSDTIATTRSGFGADHDQLHHLRK